jgi:hypothetical protein
MNESRHHTGPNNAVHYDSAAGNPEKKRRVKSLLPDEVPEVEVEVFKD